MASFANDEGTEQEDLETKVLKQWRSEGVVPIEEEDFSEDVVSIAYPQQFVALMGFFRAALKMNDHSEKALLLTECLIDYNAANYTVWYFRRICLAALRIDTAEELAYVNRMAGSNPKNYQIWYHRRALIEKEMSLELAKAELKYTATVFGSDAKNYHAWSQRQWILKTFNLWHGELEFVESLLEADVRNNSAWNQRWFVVEHTGSVNDEDTFRREIEFCMGKIEIVGDNQAAWNYFSGLMRKRDFANYPGIAEWVERGSAQESVAAPHLAVLVDVLENRSGADSKARAREVCSTLASSADTIRKNYWRWREERIK